MIGIWVAAAFLVAAAALGALTWPEVWLSQPTALTLQDPMLAWVAFLLGAVGLAVLGATLGAPALAERRWRGARDLIAEDVARDAGAIFRAVDRLLHGGEKREAALDELYRIFNDDTLAERLRYLTPALSSDMTMYISEYMERRAYIVDNLSLVDADDGQILTFTDRRYFRLPEWRFSELPRSHETDPHFVDYASCWRAFRGIGDLATLVIEHPMGGWRANRDFDAVFALARDLLRRY